MAVGLRLEISGPRGTSERAFARLPVLIGRESPSQCLIEDGVISKVHASIDVREGMICCRDAGSLNGTYVGHERLPSNRWIPLARTDQRLEIRLGKWIIRATMNAHDTPAPSVSGSTLANMLDELNASAPPAAVPTAAPMGTLAVPDMQRHQVGGDPRAIASLGELCRRSEAALNALYVAAIPILESAPPASRATLCENLARTYPHLLKDETFFAVFRSHGWTPTREAPAGPLGAAALGGLQAVARWYLGADRTLSTEADVVAFIEKLRATLDEVLMGYVPLVEGLNRFEREMALKPGATSGPPSAAELARDLLDWRKPADGALLRVRASFADLMMHQVALLNGVMGGVKTLLTELAPAQIEKALQRKRGATFSLFRIFSRPDPWPLYKERHSDLSDEENERFKLLFGPEFAAEYQQFTRESRVVETSVKPVANEGARQGSKLATG